MRAIEWAPSSRATLRMVDAVGAEGRRFLDADAVPDDDGEVLVIQVDGRGAPMISSTEHARRRQPKRRTKGTRRHARRLRRNRRGMDASRGGGYRAMLAAWPSVMIAGSGRVRAKRFCAARRSPMSLGASGEAAYVAVVELEAASGVDCGLAGIPACCDVETCADGVDRGGRARDERRPAPRRARHGRPVRRGTRRRDPRRMLTVSAGAKVYLAVEPVDLRRGHDGLCALVRGALGLDPYGGHFFVFVGKRGDRIKILFWDRGGFVVYYNQLSSHYISFD